MRGRSLCGRPAVLLALAVVAALVITACGSSGAGNEASEEIVIGAYGPLTGPTAQYGENMMRNIELYFDEVNANGGINGRKIRLIKEDDEGKADKGINAVKKLIEQDHVVAILGGPLSTVNLAAMQESMKAKVPHIATSSGNPKITESGNPYILRVVPKDTAIAAAVARYAAEVAGFSKIAILHGSDEYGKGGGEAARATLESLGITPVAVEVFNPGDKDFTPQLSKFKQAGAEAIIFWGFYEEGALLAKQNAAQGLNAQIIAGTGVNNPKFVELAGEHAEGVLFGSPFVASDPAVKDYVEKYKERYGELPDMTGACGYDAAQLIVAAIREVGTDREKINEWLHNVKDFKGVTGVLTAQPNGDLNDAVKVVKIHADGTQTVIWDPNK